MGSMSWQKRPREALVTRGSGRRPFFMLLPDKVLVRAWAERK